MNKDVSAISESYKTRINPQFILQENFSNLYKTNAILELQEWYDYDIESLNELLINEGLGDALKSVGQKLGGAVKGIGNFALKKLATALGKVLKMAMPSEEEAQNLVSEVERLKSDETYLKQQATAGNRLLGGGENEASEEFYESNKEFLLNVVFTESNLRDLFTSVLLTEAKGGKPKKSAKPAKASKSADKPTKPSKASKNIPVSAGGFEKNSVKALDTHINDLVKIISGMRAGQKKMAFNRIARSLAKQTKLEFPQPYPRQPKEKGTPQMGSLPSTSATPSGSQLATQASKELATQDSNELSTQDIGFDTATGQPQLGQGKSKFDRDNVIDAEFTDVSDKALPAPQQQPTTGLFKRIMGYIKAHPRITSSIAIALIAAATAASGGALLPLVIGGLTSGGVKAGVTAYGSKKEGGKVDWSKTVDALFTGAATGVGATAAGQGIGRIAQKLGSVGSQIDAPSVGDSDAGVEDVSSTEGDTTEGGDADYTGGTNDIQADSSDFQKYNGEPLDPKSWRDNIKMNILSKLKRAGGGSIDATKYNNAVQKLMSLGNAAKGRSIESIMGESYTAQYLNFF